MDRMHQPFLEKAAKLYEVLFAQINPGGIIR